MYFSWNDLGVSIQSFNNKITNRKSLHNVSKRLCNAFITKIPNKFFNEIITSLFINSIVDVKIIRDKFQNSYCKNSNKFLYNGPDTVFINFIVKIQNKFVLKYSRHIFEDVVAKMKSNFLYNRPGDYL